MTVPVYTFGDLILFSIPGATERQHLTLREDRVVLVLKRRLAFGQGHSAQFVTARDLPRVIAELEAGAA